MRKTLLALAAITCLTVIAGCDYSSSNEPVKQADLYYAYPTENLMGDLNYLDPDSDDYEDFIARDYTLRFNAMKNEYEAAQLIIHANKYINHVDFELPDVSDGTNVIGKENFSIMAAHYLEVTASCEKDSYIGFYPDALVPLDKHQWRKMDRIEKDWNQALYFNLLTTKDMIPGKYTGIGKLKLDNQTYDIPFEVTIYDEVMPDEIHQQSLYLIWYEQLSIGEKHNDSPEMKMTYYNECLKKRVTPDGLPESYEQTPEMLANAIYEFAANNPKVTKYRLPTTDNCSKASVISTLAALANKNIQLRQAGDSITDLFKKCIYYVDDEPNAASYPNVVTHDKNIYEAKKYVIENYLQGYPDLAESCLKIGNLVTCAYTEELVATEQKGGVQTWCPQYSQFATKEKRALYQSRKQSQDRACGEDVWWYGCMDPISPFPSFHLDADLLNSRTLRYLQYCYNISGNIYWNVCWYSKYQKGATTARDVWNDPQSWLKCNGDGYLFYPGLEYGMKTPITTLRMESVLASNEEYEYLWLMDQYIKAYNEANSTDYSVNSLLVDFYSNIFTNMKTICTDGEFNEARVYLLDVLQTMKADTKAGIDKLLAYSK